MIDAITVWKFPTALRMALTITNLLFLWMHFCERKPCKIHKWQHWSCIPALDLHTLRRSCCASSSDVSAWSSLPPSHCQRLLHWMQSSLSRLSCPPSLPAEELQGIRALFCQAAEQLRSPEEEITTTSRVTCIITHVEDNTYFRLWTSPTCTSYECPTWCRKESTFGAFFYIPWIPNMGTGINCLSPQARWPILFCRSTQSTASATSNAGQTGKRIGRKWSWMKWKGRN